MVNDAKDFICQGSSAMKVQNEQGIGKSHKQERGTVQEKKRSDIKDNANVLPEQG